MISITETNKSINDLYQVCLQNNIPFVSFSLPQSAEIKTYVQYKTHPRKFNVKNELNKSKGFVFAPFTDSDSFPAYILEPNKIISGNLVNADFLQKLELVTTFQSIDIDYQTEEKSTPGQKYEDGVNELCKLIAGGNLNKLVLSRIYIKDFENRANISGYIQQLFLKYPNAFRYIINIPKEGIWLGATPEPLITITENTANLVSLAGTQKLNGVPVTHIKWNNKELNEQYIVSEYIENMLSVNKIEGYTSKGPISVSAANVVHLQTQFTFPAELIKNNLGEFVSTLHPTPSISGMPKDKALALIPCFEKHQRRYYAGFLGPVNNNIETYLFINLRCARYAQNKMTFFAGAGITQGSIAEREWEETNQKLYTMLSLL
jgi:isochorismate synthase